MPDPYRVLIIDDNQELVRAAALRLHAAGYETRSAYDGEQGVATAVEWCPSAIVLDVQMPHMDGLTALTELKASDATRDIPVIMLSASIFDEQAALQAGARYFLKKPYESLNLLHALATAMRN
jgi:two-component system response regulator PrrA